MSLEVLIVSKYIVECQYRIHIPVVGGFTILVTSIGAECIATGHYARIEKLPNGRYAIKKSVTAEKDQTYALYNLTQSPSRFSREPQCL